MEKCKYSDGELAEMSDRVVAQLLGMKFFSAKVVLLYCPLADEVWLDESLFVNWDDHKVLLPKVVGDDLELRIFDGFDSLEKGAFGILEPVGEMFTDYDAVDFVVVPGMAFDKAGHRLGRGKGYYDRLLPRLRNAYKIGVCFPFQFFDEIPSEPHDVRMDCVVCGGLLRQTVRQKFPKPEVFDSIVVA